MQQVWEERKVVGDSRDAEIVPLQKTGDYQICHNCHGINLINVGGEVIARILQEWL